MLREDRMTGLFRFSGHHALALRLLRAQERDTKAIDTTSSARCEDQRVSEGVIRHELDAILAPDGHYRVAFKDQASGQRVETKGWGRGKKASERPDGD